MNKKRINKNLMLDLFYQYLLESNDDLIYIQKTSKINSIPTVAIGIHRGEYKISADKENNKLIIKSYFINGSDNFQTYAIGSQTAALYDIPRSIYDVIESRLIKNGYIK